MIPNNKLFILISVLGFWLILGVIGCFLWIPADTRILALALLAFTVTLTVTNLFRYSGWVAVLASILVYASTEIGLGGWNGSVLPTLGLVIIGIVIAFVLAEAVRREAMQINKQLDSSQKLIEELRQFDPVTGIMRYQQALRMLRSEVVRSQRFGKKVCVFFMQIENLNEMMEERGAEGVEATKRQVVGALVSSVRATDIPFGGEKFGAVLPETDLASARTVLDRLVSAMLDKVHVSINIGIAQFPEDGVTEVELVKAAEAALTVALQTEKPVIQYQQIRDLAEGTKTVS